MIISFSLYVCVLDLGWRGGRMEEGEVDDLQVGFGFGDLHGGDHSSFRVHFGWREGDLNHLHDYNWGIISHKGVGETCQKYSFDRGDMIF